MFAGLLLTLSLAAADPTADPSAARLRTIVESLAHDSTAGRKTPSRELEKAAAYIAATLRESGAAPLGDEGSFFQKYPIVESLLSQESADVTVGSKAKWKFGSDFFYAGGAGGDPRGELRGNAIIVTGRITDATASTLGVRNKIVFFVSPLTARGAPEDFRSAFALGGAGARAVILPGGRADSLWRRLSADRDELMPSWTTAWPLWYEAERDSTRVAFRPVLELWRDRWASFVASSSLDSSTFRNADGSPRVTELADEVVLDFARDMQQVSWPSNVVGVVRGSDPVLRNEYVVLTAHYDGLGSERGRPPGPQSILNGADDNASGVAVLLEIARAVAARPGKRSVIFAAVSGEENGLWGSDYLAARPPVPVKSIVANVNMDMVGRPSGDTVYVTGRSASDAGRIAHDAIARTGGMVVVGETELEQRFPGQHADERSDHASFRHRGVPAVSFFTGWHADYHETTDDADKVNYAALEKIAAMALNATVAIANGRITPRN